VDSNADWLKEHQRSKHGPGRRGSDGGCTKPGLGVKGKRGRNLSKKGEKKGQAPTFLGGGGSRDPKACGVPGDHEGA